MSIDSKIETSPNALTGMTALLGSVTLECCKDFMSTKALASEQIFLEAPESTIHNLLNGRDVFNGTDKHVHVENTAGAMSEEELSGVELDR